MTAHYSTKILAVALLAGGVLSVSLRAQDATDPPASEAEQVETQPIEQPEAAPEESGADPLDLDDLLRLPGSDRPLDRSRQDADGLDTELDRRLSGRQAQQALIQAVQEMGEVADRLAQLRDAGITTQRLQQEVITKLDILIKRAEEQSGSPSGSSSSQQQQQQPGQQPSQPTQTPGEGAQSGESPPPGRQGEQLNQNLDLSVAEWGNLPERLRQSLIQGQSDYFSDMYRRWTESYYRRLAEEASR